jgi:hypothetical protein
MMSIYIVYIHVKRKYITYPPPPTHTAVVADGVHQTLTHGSANRVIRCLYLCAQGLLAGFACLSIYSLSSFDNDEDFLLNYQNSANEIRR